MSFLTIFENVAEETVRILGPAAKAAGPVVTAFNPVAGLIVTLAGDLLIEAEVAFPQPKSGNAKKAYVMQKSAQSLEFFSAGVRSMGGHVDDAKIRDLYSQYVDNCVAHWNNLAAIQAGYTAAKP